MSKIHKSMLVAAALCTVSVSASGLEVVSPPPTTTPPPPPNCSGVAPTVLWPPDHKMVSVSIVDPTNPELAILITKIMQDEPVDAPGSGNTSPDAILPDPEGTNTNTAMIRAERAGPGTGRIYFLSFTATDNTTGLQCTSTAKVFVPHDQGQGYTPMDTGDRYDSTKTF